MNKLFMFDEAGNCIATSTNCNVAIMDEMAKRNGASHYAVGDASIPMERAALGGGKVVEITPTVSTEALWARVREQRDGMMAATDWVVTKATETGSFIEPQWISYRQALRDITQQSDPANINWPTPPQK
jgi:hypothetical protein